MKRKSSVEYLVGTSLTCLDDSFEIKQKKLRKLNKKLTSEDMENCFLVANSLLELLNQII